MPDSDAVEVSAKVVGRLREIVGDENVLNDPADLMVYECDAYTLEKKLPGAVVLPANTREVAAVVKLCAEEDLPVIPRGAGTSLSGTVLAVTGGVMIGLSRMNTIEDVDYRNRRAMVQAGVVNAWITQRVKGNGLLYAPDPSSQPACTIGGNVGTNSGGPHTLKYGVTTNHILGFEMVLPDGEIVWLGSDPESGDDVDGYDLRGGAIGSEGMFGIVTRVLVRLIRAPKVYKTMLGVFESVEAASQTVSDIIGAGIVPGALEMMDQLITGAIEEAYHFGFPLDAGALLIVELDGLDAGMNEQVDRVIDICKNNGAREVRLAKSEQERADLWKCRKRAFGAIGRLSPSYLTQDGVVPRSKLPEIMQFILATSQKYELRIPNVFHAGDGNIHPLILFDDRIPEEVAKAVKAGEDILEKCVELGGSVTGEHGIGIEKVSFMARQFSAETLDVMMSLRDVFDPERRFNPHKMFPGGKRCSEFVPKKQIAA
ncbi:MAG: FAD-binding oxidoreductase [Limisphaerales bacterium]